ncbi:MAG: hypothetical protein QW548_02150 [Candidatus Aenigmatarchaeota archaeon]
MKTFAVVVLAAAAVAAVVAAYAILPSLLQPRSAGEVLHAAAAKLANLTEYSLSYNMSNSIAIGEDSANMTGTMRIMRKGAHEKTTISFAIRGQTISVDVYSIASGSYSCQASFGGIVCERFNGSLPAPSPIDQVASLLDLVSQDFVSVRAASAQQSLKPCDAVAFDYDVKKMMANVSLPEEYAEGIEAMAAYACFDAETGLPLIFEQHVRLSAEAPVESVMRMAATQLELAAPEIRLPAGAKFVEA